MKPVDPIYPTYPEGWIDGWDTVIGRPIDGWPPGYTEFI